jgi:hypothetical protein
MPPILNDAPGAQPAAPSAVNLSQLTDPILQLLLSQNPAGLFSHPLFFPRFLIFGFIVLEIYKQVLQMLQVHIIGLQKQAPTNPKQPTPLLDSNLQIALLSVLMARWIQQVSAVHLNGCYYS